MSDDAKYLRIAQTNIARKGRNVFIQKLDHTFADPDKPWLGGQGVSDEYIYNVQTKCVFIPSMGRDLGVYIEDKDLLKRVEQVGLVAHTTTDFTDAEIVLDGVVKYHVEWMQFLRPGDSPILYYIGLKR